MIGSFIRLLVPCFVCLPLSCFQLPDPFQSNLTFQLIQGIGKILCYELVDFGSAAPLHHPGAVCRSHNSRRNLCTYMYCTDLLDQLCQRKCFTNIQIGMNWVKGF